MSNIVHVQFGKKNVIAQQEVPDDNEPSLTAYLDSLREAGVDDEDILETIDAINDVNIYLNADEVIKEFADGWLHQFL